MAETFPCARWQVMMEATQARLVADGEELLVKDIKGTDVSPTIGGAATLVE
jgi:hypothetical protein